MRKQTLIMGGIFIGGVLLGAGGGYLLADKFLEKAYEEKLDNEIKVTKEFYAVLNKQGDYDSPEKVTESRGIEVNEDEDVEPDRLVVEAATAVTNYQGKFVVQKDRKDEQPSEPPTVDVEKRNIFVSSEPLDPGEWDYDTEMASRTSDRPYIISHDEFMENEKDYDQTSITYYAGDDVLVDSYDRAVEDYDSMVGEDNLLKFGHGSNDPRIVYIRNEKLELDFEVTYSKGKYAHEVMGMDEDELEHSSTRRGVRRFRGDDE